MAGTLLTDQQNKRSENDFHSQSMVIKKKVVEEMGISFSKFIIHNISTHKI